MRKGACVPFFLMSCRRQRLCGEDDRVERAVAAGIAVCFQLNPSIKTMEVALVGFSPAFLPGSPDVAGHRHQLFRHVRGMMAPVGRIELYVYS